MPSHFGHSSNKSKSTKSSGGNSNRESYRTGSSYQSSGKKASSISQKNAIKKEMNDFANYSYQKPQGLAKFSPVAQFFDITGIGKKAHEVNKAYYQKNVIGKTNPATGKPYSASITEYKNYLKGRTAGTLDAMGRTILSGGNDKNTTPTIMAEAQAPVQTPTQTVAQAEEEIKPKKAKIIGSGYGQQNILSSASGVEDEANVSRTVLGGGVKRKIRL